MLPEPGHRASKEDLAHLIGRQIKTAANARYLGRLPGLEVERGIPPAFEELLDKLHDAESRGQRPRTR